MDSLTHTAQPGHAPAEAPAAVADAGFPTFLLEVHHSPVNGSDLEQTLRNLLAASGIAVSLRPAADAAHSEQRAADARARAELRGEARLIGWTLDGTLIESNKLADAWNVHRQTLDAARERGELFSVRIHRQHWYPAVVLRMARDEMAAVNRALGDTDPVSKLLFFLRPHGALAGLTAEDAIKAGRLDDVVRLAHGWAAT